MIQTLTLLNESVHTSDLVHKLDGESESLNVYAAESDPTVHRTSKARRPYWKIGPRKARDRVLAKAANDYNELEAPSTSYVLDLVRCTAYFDDPMTLALCFDILDVLGDIVRVKNRFIKPGPHGYRDMMLNIRMSNSHIAEIQLGFDSLMILKEWMHPNYALARTDSTQELVNVCKENAGLLPRATVIRFPDDDAEEGLGCDGQEEFPYQQEHEGSALVISVNSAIAALQSDDEVSSVPL